METIDAGLVRRYHKILSFWYRAIKCPKCGERNVHQMFYENQTGDDFFKCFSCEHHYYSG